MTALSVADAQLNLYFGDGNRPLTHSQSQANLLTLKCNSSSSLSESCGSVLSEFDAIGASSSSYSDNEDIYSVVAWQLGHDRIDNEERVGSVSDTAAQITPKNHKKFNRKGLKWKFKKLFQQKKTSPIKQIEKKKKMELCHSQSTMHLATQNVRDCIPKSIKLQSPTNREIRFELLLYEKHNKARYKLMDNKLHKCICPNVQKFDIKSFLSKHRMSIDFELQLIQTLQCYKEVMLKTNNMNMNIHSQQSSSSMSLSLSSSPNPINNDEDESDANFDLFHITTPRRKCHQQFENIVERIYDRYRKHTAQNNAYCKLKKKQLRIEQFYKNKVADKHSVALLAEKDKIHFLETWSSGKRGLKLPKNELNKIKNSSLSESSREKSEEFKQSIPQQTEIEDADDECLSDEDDEDDQSEDDSDASMDSDELKRILFESSMELKQKRKQHKLKTNKGGKKNKMKNKKRVKEKEKVDPKNVSYASLKPPSNKRKKKKKKRKEKRKAHNNKKRKKCVPRFMQKKSKSQTPRRKAHKLKLCDINNSDSKQKNHQSMMKRAKISNCKKRKRSISKSFKLSDNSFDILFVDRLHRRISINKASQSDVGGIGSEYFGSLHSPQYLRLKSKNLDARMVPMRILDFGKDDC